ncbi:MAG TPA: GDSL-type esterase/lipase family protein [Candidatus Limnocylindria bacterium]|nr:GDSL-type esterase/lipase family protein [Candidatus Limnocylindria bacterium]
MLPGTGPVRFLALGDSYTIGAGVAAAEDWPAVLVERLRARGIAIEDPEIIARTGWTTDELAAGIERARPRGPYLLVTLLIGVNDQARGAEPDEYRRAFSARLRQAVELAGGKPGRVIVLSIPDWSVTPFAASQDQERIAATIVRFNQAKRDQAERRRALRRRDGDLAARGHRSRPVDGLHPSRRMYEAWVEWIMSAALTALGHELAPARAHHTASTGTDAQDCISRVWKCFGAVTH